MIGIYKITNNINNKVYIGQSKQIIKRWEEHIRHCLAKKNDNIHLINAVNKYGIENFSFSIVEICSINELNDKEIFYIKQFNSNNEKYGYNISYGGNNGQHARGENNPNSKMSSEQIYQIREDYNNHISKKDVYKKYENIISINTFNDIWQGKTWKDVHMDVYTQENKFYHKNNYDKIKARENVRVFSDEDILFIRNQYNLGEKSAQEVYNYFLDKNYNTFMDIWQGKTFKHIQSTIPNNHKRFLRHSRGETHNTTGLLTKEQVINIRTRYNNGEKVGVIYNDYKNIVSKHTIYNVINNITYKYYN